jgi:hypothetical protein
MLAKVIHVQCPADFFLSSGIAIHKLNVVSPNTYTLPKGKILYHATTAKFAAFLEKPTWFSPDQFEGWKMAMWHASFPPRPLNVYVRKVASARDLTLFLMKPTEELSRAALLENTAWKWTKEMLQNHWYAIGAKKTSQFVDDFCRLMGAHGFHGWRNPWDQDEIMLCSTPVDGYRLADKIEYAQGGWFCPPTKWDTSYRHWMRPTVTTDTDSALEIGTPYYGRSISDVEIRAAKRQPGPAIDRMHFFVLGTPKDRRPKT